MEIFVNLTAGIEAIQTILRPYFKQIQFIRIQSTYCEQKLLERVLIDLDNNFLMKLAIGKECIVFDFTSRKKKYNTSRACWQGLSWIKYCLERIWFNRHIKFHNGMEICFKEHFESLSKPTLRKIKYYRKFLLTKNINLLYVSQPTDNDSNIKFYKEIVRKYL